MTPAQKAAVDAAVAHTRIEQIRSALKAPLPAADPKEKPQGLLEALDAKYHLKLYTFDTKVSQENTKAWSAQDSPTTAPAAPAAAGPAAAPATAPTDSPEDTSQGTDIAAALGKALADLGSDKLAGVVLISDGRHNANTSLDAATRQVGILQAPVCCMVAGSSRPPMDAAVIAVEAPETVYARNKTFVNAQLKLDGLAGRVVHVQLMDGAAVKDTQTVTVPSESYRTFVGLSDTPETAGIHSYHVEVEKFPGEAFTDNNSYPLTLSVTEDRARLLIVDERPRWEFRYLKNLFAGRDNSVRLQYVLMAADRIEEIPPPAPVAASVARGADEVEAYALPANEGEWMKFDVAIVGDLPPSRLAGEQMTWLKKFVTDRGGTLVVIAGPEAMPQSYAGTAMADLLPVRLPTQPPPSDSGEGPFRMAH